MNMEQKKGLNLPHH